MEPTLEETPEESGLRFSVRTLLWAVTLSFAGIATFGFLYGSYLAILAITIPRVFTSIRNDERKLTMRLLLVIFSAHFLIPFVYFSLVIFQRFQLQSDLSLSSSKKWEMLTWILDYEATHGHFPKAYTTDEDGNRLHSWRTLLPQMHEVEYYASIDRKKPWNHKKNINRLKASEIDRLRIATFEKQKESMNAKSYFAVVDKETVWSPNYEVKISDITDDLDSTIVLIEVTNKHIPWYEPRDLSLEEAIDVLVGKPQTDWFSPSLFYTKRLSGNGYSNRIGFADGSMRVIAPIASRDTARALLTRSGGEVLPVGWGTNFSTPEELVLGYVIHWDRIGSTLLFVILAVLPLWKRKARRADSA